MQWIENHTQPTFDGIPIHYNEILNEVGRRIAVFESPLTNGADFNDMARLPRKFTFNGFIAGNDILDQLLRLMAALEAPGAHVFHHPYFGEYRVVIVGHVPLPIRSDQGGVVRFSLPMMQVEDSLDIVAPRPAGNEVSKTALLLQKKAFTKKFKRPKAPFLDGVLAAIRAVNSKIRKITGQIMGPIGKIDHLATEITQFENAVNNLINTPELLAAAIGGLISTVFSLFTSAVEDAEELTGLELRPKQNFAEIAYRSLAAIMSVDSSAFLSSKSDNAPSPEMTVQSQSLTQLDALVKIGALSGAASYFLSPGVDFESANQAEEARDAWAEYADNLLYKNGLDLESFVSLSAMRGSVYRELTQIASRLPRVYIYEPVRVMTSMVLAYELYGDPRRRTEIINRNKIKNPFFIPAGQPIEILSYDPQ